MVFEEYRSALREALLPSLILGLLERHQSLAQTQVEDFLDKLGVRVASGVLNRIMRRLVRANLCTVERDDRDGRLRIYRVNLNTSGYRALVKEDFEDFEQLMSDILEGHHHVRRNPGPFL